MSSERITASLKHLVIERAKSYCEYCCIPSQYSPGYFTVDHIKPSQTGGKTTLDNLALSCHGCNSIKHTKVRAIDPKTGKEVTLFNPRQQVWSEHFTWSEDFLQVIGITGCGRATVIALTLNRMGLVNLRELLVKAGLHPPPEV
jgi:HNH endonuclease